MDDSLHAAAKLIQSYEKTLHPNALTNEELNAVKLGDSIHAVKEDYSRIFPNGAYGLDVIGVVTEVVDYGTGTVIALGVTVEEAGQERKTYHCDRASTKFYLA